MLSLYEPGVLTFVEPIKVKTSPVHLSCIEGHIRHGRVGQTRHMGVDSIDDRLNVNTDEKT